MGSHLQYLLQIQDLDLMLRELGNEKTASAEKKLGFQLSGTETLQKARDLLASKVDSEQLKLYERLAGRYPRAIVPMRDGICFGCFVRQAAKKAFGDVDPTAVETCQRCGRILFKFSFP